MSERRRHRDALADLLVRRATERLTPEDDAALEQLQTEFPDVEPDAYDRAAAAVWLAASGARTAAMPADIAGRILARVRPAGTRD